LPNPLLLLDETDQADIAEPIHARVSDNDVFVEYQDIADDAMRVSEFRHYLLGKGELRLTDPVALTPGDFGRSGCAIRGRRSPRGPSLPDPPLHPPSRPLAGRHRSGGQPKHRRSLLPRPRPPFRFTMVGASESPWPDCTENDPAIDHAPDFFDK
jgi:hypothetical protein